MDKRPNGGIFPPAQATRPAGGNGATRALAESGAPTETAPKPPPKPPATETLARRTGALINEVDFPGFVAQLVNGTFDAIVDASIRQMESYSSLVSAVAKTVDQFTEENVSPNQARDWLAQHYPAEIVLMLPTAEEPEPHLVPRSEGLSPAWLADFGLEGQELSTELLESTLVAQVRRRVGSERHQLLATMVLLGINRVTVRDGSISAKVMFRAAAQDSAKVAVSADPPKPGNWGERGSQTYGGASTMVSTLAVNAQSDTSIRADLFGEVKLNFVSETLPLDKLADAAKIALVQRGAPGVRQTPAAPATPTPTPTPDPDKRGDGT